MSNRKTRRKAEKTENVSVEMATQFVAEDKSAADMALLDALLNEAGVPRTDDPAPAAAESKDEATEVIEPVDGTIPEAALDAAADALDKQEFYEQQSDPAASTTEGDKPQVSEEPAKPAKKVKGEKKAKTPKPATEKTPAAPRVTYHGHSKSAVLDNRLGGRTADFLVLETSDAALDPAELAAKQSELKDALDNKLAKKVAEKCVMLFKDIGAGRKVSNEVMVRAFSTLARDGFLTSGDKGNMQAALADKYSIGTARSQSNQMFALFPFLKITVKDGKGRQVPNPNSTILSTVLTLHGLTLKQA